MKKIKILLCFFFLSAYGYAQDSTQVSVTVYDHKKNPLRKVSVELVGHDVKTTTPNGKMVFTLGEKSIGTQQKLKFSLDGYIPKDSSFYLKRAPKDNDFDFFLQPSDVPVVVKSYYKGRVLDATKNALDSVSVNLYFPDQKPLPFKTQNNGIFYFELNAKYNKQKVTLIASKNGYGSFENEFIINSIDDMPNVIVLEKESSSRIIYGTVKHGNKPLGGVLVQAEGAVSGKKSVLTSEDPEMEGKFQLVTHEKTTRKDSIVLTLSKDNFKTVKTVIDLENPDLITSRTYRLNYEDATSHLCYNNITFKVAIPYHSLKEWYFGLDYYHTFSIFKDKYFDVGFGGSYLSYAHEDDVETFRPSKDYSTEIKDKEWFINTSLRYWLVSPQRRYWATYVGFSPEYAINSQNFAVFPFAGTRIDMDQEWSIGLEFKYLYGNFTTIDKQFNYFGKAVSAEKEEDFNRLLINIFISWRF